MEYERKGMKWINPPFDVDNHPCKPDWSDSWWN